MLVKIIKDSFWFTVGSVVDIDYFVAKQLIQMGNAEAVNKKGDDHDVEVNEKVDQTASKRVKK